jgi:tRNA modification GTPase
VVRLSGPGAVVIARHMFRLLGGAKPDVGAAATASFEPNQSFVGRVIDLQSGEPLDTAVVTYFKAPRSYTGEDVIEISCHGSPVVLASVLGQSLSLGARLAEPGEFTMRAFLNHRIDLAQAQAVRDLIDAQTAYQARLATRQVEGALSKRIGPFKEALVDVIVNLESSLEFVEDDISPETTSASIKKLADVTAGLAEIASSFALGRFVRQGFDLAIVGRPNVGKSSIFNRLIGVDRAIVTEIPGTTRDALHESSSIHGIPVRLIDTAGIRETTDIVESIGITRSREAIAAADIQLLVLDGSEPLTQDDTNLIEQTPASSRILLINKSDLHQRLDDATLRTGRHSMAPMVPGRLDEGEVSTGGAGERHLRIVKISAATGEGFDTLEKQILDRLGGNEVPGDDILITDARQHQAIRNAIAAVVEGRDLMVHRELEEIVLLKLRAGLQAIGEITGETLNDDILSQIFSTFCIGK